MVRNFLIFVLICVICLFKAGCQPVESARAEPDAGVQGTAFAAETKKVETRQKPTIAKTEPTSKQAGPMITFEEKLHDFGEIGPATSHVYKFKFKNTGTDTLKIGKIHTTCGCTVAKLSKKDYQPGESGAIEVKYSAGRIPGSTTKRLHVSSNDKKNPKVTLMISAKVKLKVDYEPKKLKLSLRKENAGCPKITVKSLDGKAFSVMHFNSTDRCIIADVNSAFKATEIVIEPKVDIEKLRKRTKGKVSIGLSHPSLTKINIPFEALPEFKIDPPSINVLNAQPQQPAKRSLWVLSNYKEEFEIASTSSQNGFVKVVKREKLGHRYKFELEITPPAKENKRTFTDVFFVNIKGLQEQQLRVKCRGFYARQRKRSQVE